MRRPDRGRPIARSIVALAIGSVLLATAILFVVTFSGPPPREPPRGVETIAAALRGPAVPARRGSGTKRPPGPRLIVRRSATPPLPTAGLVANPGAAARLAAELNAAPRDVVAFTSNASGGPPGGFPDAFFGRFAFGWHVAGSWRVVESAPPPFFLRWHWRTLAAMLLTLALLALPAWGIARAITRPLRQLAAAAEQARAGAERPAFPDDGPAEIRKLTAAVSQMHDRLQHHADQRTTMLAAIAHDLGTPLSRLAFHVEQLPEPARERAAADIEEMRAMIAGTIRFAAGETGEREQTLVDLGSLLDSLVEDMRVDGTIVALAPGPRVVVRGDPVALRRVFQNLIGNAVRYAGNASVGWRSEAGEAVAAVTDSGPGLGDADPERLFDPFVRGDPSRNRATGGTGLGLAIVRAIVERHGGTATLADNRPAPGATATVRLPLAG